jgi:hypothetical protein
VKKGNGIDNIIKCTRCDYHKNLKYSTVAKEPQCDKCIKGYGVTVHSRLPEEHAGYVDIMQSPLADKYKKQEYYEYLNSLPVSNTLAAFLESCQIHIKHMNGLSEQLSNIIYFDDEEMCDFKVNAVCLCIGLLTHSEYTSEILRANFSIGSLFLAKHLGLKTFDEDYVSYSLSDLSTFEKIKQKVLQDPRILLTFVSSHEPDN